MKTIVLPADASHDLDWTSQLKEISDSQILIEFDFGWNKASFFVNDQAAFQTFILALDQFTQKVWPLIQDWCQGVVLYRGSLSILSWLTVADEELTAIESATVFGAYLHRLASFLPDEVIPYCLFEDRAGFTIGEAAQILSQERFAHVHLSLTSSEMPRAVLLPPDELCSPQVIQKLTEVLTEEPTLRVIPERCLNELWNGLDELIVFEEVLTVQGKRQILGFEAAGGKIRSRGI
ncbi:MAG: hypothetical protein KBA81_03390 [Rhabdochlamydiaceae bacterium]|nr:hypothetical protein [Rhabdochlamydiaceae bacterium]